MIFHKEFYPTPLALIQELLKGIDLKTVRSALEPSVKGTQKLSKRHTETEIRQKSPYRRIPNYYPPNREKRPDAS